MKRIEKGRGGMRWGGEAYGGEEEGGNVLSGGGMGRRGEGRRVQHQNENMKRNEEVGMERKRGRIREKRA